jgi:uncharacterized DUF497 family protein
MEFEWDDKKAASNLEKHGISFIDVLPLFFDETTLYEVSDYSNEIRFKAIGMLNGKAYFVVYTVRQNERYRIISARRAHALEAKRYYQSLHQPPE